LRKPLWIMPWLSNRARSIEYYEQLQARTMAS
jgi:hypothetical protein